MRKMAFRGIRDYPEGSEGQIMGSREACCDMRFHIDRHRACRDMKGAFLCRMNYRRVDACNIDNRRAAQCLGETQSPRPVAFKTLSIFRNDGAADEGRPGIQARCEAAGNAETDDRRYWPASRMFELAVEPRGVASA
jgi:hypothetical protein